MGKKCSVDLSHKVRCSAGQIYKLLIIFKAKVSHIRIPNKKRSTVPEELKIRQEVLIIPLSVIAIL